MSHRSSPKSRNLIHGSPQPSKQKPGIDTALCGNDLWRSLLFNRVKLRHTWQTHKDPGRNTELKWVKTTKRRKAAPVVRLPQSFRQERGWWIYSDADNCYLLWKRKENSRGWSQESKRQSEKPRWISEHRWLFPDSKTQGNLPSWISKLLPTSKYFSPSIFSYLKWELQ